MGCAHWRALFLLLVRRAECLKFIKEVVLRGMPVKYNKTNKGISFRFFRPANDLSKIEQLFWEEVCKVIYRPTHEPCMRNVTKATSIYLSKF